MKNVETGDIKGIDLKGGVDILEHIILEETEEKASLCCSDSSA